VKRSELNVGDELYHATPGDWKGGYTSNPGRRVRVVSVAPHRKRSYDHSPTTANSGNGVLVEVLNEVDGKPMRYRWGTGYVVQLAHLRGPYAATLAAVEAQRVERNQARRDAVTARKNVAETVGKVVDQARLDGWSSVQNSTEWTTENTRYARVSMSFTDFERMLRTIDDLRAQTRNGQTGF
jgi:hypothetical protein